MVQGDGRLAGGAVQVLQRSARILDCFTSDRAQLRASDVREATNLPGTTVARILHTLVSENLLQRHGDRYSIGLRVMSWAAAADAASDLIAASQPALDALRNRCNESCAVYVRQGNMRVAVAHAMSTQSIVYQGRVGQILPLNQGAAGKVLMAFDSAARREAEGALPGEGEGDRDEDPNLTRTLAEVRDRGWALSIEEREVGLNSMAAPIYGVEGFVIAALSIGAPSFRLTPKVAESLSPVLIRYASAISQRMLSTANGVASEEPVT
ncbi:MAG: IclR family transcriptional regulator [Actinomycetes bacterium]